MKKIFFSILFLAQIFLFGACKNPEEVAGPVSKDIRFAIVRATEVSEDFLVISDDTSRLAIGDKLFTTAHVDTASFPPKVWLELSYAESGDRGKRFAQLKNFDLRIMNFSSDGLPDTLRGYSQQYLQYSSVITDKSKLPSGGGANYLVNYHGFDDADVEEQLPADPVSAFSTAYFSYTGKNEITGYINTVIRRDVSVVEKNDILLAKLSETFQKKFSELKFIPVDSTSSLLVGRMEVLRIQGKVKISY